MIRFINLTGQILIDDDEPHFAWFDTVRNEFIEFNQAQEWHTWGEFSVDLLKDRKVLTHSYYDIQETLKRFGKLYRGNNPKTHPTKTSPS